MTLSKLDYSPKNLGMGQDFKVVHKAVVKRKKQVPENLKPLVPKKAIYFEGYASKTTKDLVSDLIPSEFWSDETIAKYMENPVLLFNHNQGEVVGKILEAERRDDGLYVKGFVSASWPKSWMVDEELVTSFSVWVWADDVEYDEASSTWLLKSGRLLEISLASIPINGDAKFSIEKSLQPEQYQSFKSLFHNQKSTTMTFKFKDIPTFLKSLIPSLNTKYGIEIAENATDEQVLKAVDEAESFEDYKKSLTTELTKTISTQVLKAVGDGLKQKGITIDLSGIKIGEDSGEGSAAKSADANTGKGNANGDGGNGTGEESAIEKRLKALEDKLQDETTKRKNAEAELAQKTGQANGQKNVNSDGGTQFNTKEEFYTAMKSAEPKGKSKY